MRKFLLIALIVILSLSCVACATLEELISQDVIESSNETMQQSIDSVGINAIFKRANMKIEDNTIIYNYHFSSYLIGPSDITEESVNDFSEFMDAMLPVIKFTQWYDLIRVTDPMLQVNYYSYNGKLLFSETRSLSLFQIHFPSISPKNIWY